MKCKLKMLALYLPLPLKVKGKIALRIAREAEKLHDKLTPFANVLHTHEALRGVIETWGVLQASRGVPIPIPCPTCLRLKGEKVPLRFVFNVFKEGVPSFSVKDKDLMCDNGHSFLQTPYAEGLPYILLLSEILNCLIEKPQISEEIPELAVPIPAEMREEPKLRKLKNAILYLPPKDELNIVSQVTTMLEKFLSACNYLFYTAQESWEYIDEEDLKKAIREMKKALPTLKLALYKLESLKTFPKILPMVKGWKAHD